MIVMLMNKNTEVLKAKLENNIFTDILAVFNVAFAPYSINDSFSKNNSVLNSLNDWFKIAGYHHGVKI